MQTLIFQKKAWVIATRYLPSCLKTSLYQCLSVNISIQCHTTNVLHACPCCRCSSFAQCCSSCQTHSRLRAELIMSLPAVLKPHGEHLQPKSPSQALTHLWLPLCKVCCLLEDVGHTDQISLAKCPANNLQPHRQCLPLGACPLLKAARHHDCRKACTQRSHAIRTTQSLTQPRIP